VWSTLVRVDERPVVQIDSEHPSAFGVGPARWSGRLQRRLEAASGGPVEVVHYLEARDLRTARAIVISGSAAP
jgi:1-deoxy-D-xylulose 5-phosphate reductoisomerase